MMEEGESRRELFSCVGPVRPRIWLERAARVRPVWRGGIGRIPFERDFGLVCRLTRVRIGQPLAEWRLGHVRSDVQVRAAGDELTEGSPRGCLH